jgi:hypothetical protein
VRFFCRINRVLLSDLLETVVVTEESELEPARARLVTLRFNFLPYKYYKQNFGVKPDKVRYS